MGITTPLHREQYLHCIYCLKKMTTVTSSHMRVLVFLVLLLVLLLQLRSEPVAASFVPVVPRQPRRRSNMIQHQMPRPTTTAITAPTTSKTRYYYRPLLIHTRQQQEYPRRKTTTTLLLTETNEVVQDNQEYSPSSTTSSTSNVGYKLSLFASVISWTTIAFVALSKHPTPAIHAVTSFRHNCFTIAQALAFPVPVLISSFLELMSLSSSSSSSPKAKTSSSRSFATSFRRLNLGIAIASLWSAAAVIWGRTFSVGYDLFSTQPVLFRVGIPMVQTVVALYCLYKWNESVQATNVSSSSSSTDKRTFPPSYYISRLVNGCIESLYSLLSPPIHNVKAQCYALTTKCLFVLALLPQLVSFPTATIPTLLGKRLSRAASGYTWLGAIGLLCLYQKEKEKQQDDSNSKSSLHYYLQRGLKLGSLLHISLVWAKIIGFDGGGIVLPGRGLWKDYPSLVNASLGSKCLMMITYPLIVYTTSMDGKRNTKSTTASRQID